MSDAETKAKRTEEEVEEVPTADDETESEGGIQIDRLEWETEGAAAEEEEDEDGRVKGCDDIGADLAVLRNRKMTARPRWHYLYRYVVNVLLYCASWLCCLVVYCSLLLVVVLFARVCVGVNFGSQWDGGEGRESRGTKGRIGSEVRDSES